MALIVGVHGIAQQFKGSNVLQAEWLPPLRDGLDKAGVKLPKDADLACASYGELFRPPGTKKAVGLPHFEASDINTGLE
jgi:hypothetical protein